MTQDVVGSDANPEIVITPEGFFLMGSECGQENERLRHRVWVDSFRLDDYQDS